MSESLSQFPARNTSFQDKNGEITPVWYRFLFGVWSKTGGGSSSTTIPELVAAIAALVLSVAGKAPLNSPHFTGVPTAPTAAPGANTTQLATTAFDTAAVAVETTRATTAEALLAPKASPGLTGVPTAPTAAPGTNTTQLATTAFDTAAVAVETSRATTAEALLAPKASPTLTGTPSAPTAAPGTNTTQLATTAYSTAAVLVETNRAVTAEALLAPIASPSFTGNALVAGGVGVWGHAAPGVQPAAPVTLADVIAIIRGCGLSA